MIPESPPQAAAEASTPFHVSVRASVLRALDYDLRGRTSRAADQCLQRVREALRADNLARALREMDRGWRSLPDEAETLAPLYGRLLALEERDLAAALRLLQTVRVPDPDVAALTARALLSLGREADARRQLEAALGDYCVREGELLAQVAAEVAQRLGSGVPGWIGLASSLEFTGEFTAAEAVHSLEILIDGGAAFTQPIRASQDGARSFRFKLPQLARDAPLTVLSHGVPLLGSGLTVPSDFGLDGRARVSRRLVTGWARLGWRPTRPVTLRIEDETGASRRLKTRAVADAGLRWPFRVDLKRGGLRGRRIRISAELPDGRWHPLPDAPLLLADAVRLPGKPLPSLLEPRGRVVRRSAPRRMPPTDVIIPVYRGRDETLACIASVLATVDAESQVIVVDDATPDPALAAALDGLAAAGSITLLRNESNLGFVASANRALALHPAHDVVLLNSDALVFGDWLVRLRAAAYAAGQVGTVTPFSNSGSIASYPRNDERPLTTEAAAALHALAAATHAGTSLEIPVGVGFCLYVRRECLREVGLFDAAVFDKGYGEETDFCLRARRRGWSHRLAADVFVYHAGGRSFGSRRAALMERSARLLELRHPGFHAFIAGFERRDPLRAARRRLDEERLTALGRRCVLLVSLALPGGVERYVTARARELKEQGYLPLVLRPAEVGNAGACVLTTEALDAPNLRYEIPDDLDELTALLRRLPLETVEIQHFLHLDARVLEAIRALGVPYDVSLHDYAWVCPRVTLMDGSGRYCGEPAVTVCTACVKRHGSHLDENISVPQLRSRSARWLRGARHVFAPTTDTAARFEKHFGGLSVAVRPHAPAVAPPPPMLRSTPSPTVRVALVGAIGEHKGYSVLHACARDAAARRLPLEFIVIGYTGNDAPLLKTGKVFITGRYGEGEAPHLLQREQIDITFLPSVWPETWCYTLDDAVSAGVPIVAFDLGAIAERLRAIGLGNLIPLDTDPCRINDRLLALGRQTVLPPESDAATMAPDEVNSMNRPAAEESKLEDDALTASVQVLPLPPGLYLFSVKAAVPTPKRIYSQLQVPAMHVGLGPGVRAEHVEFVAGPATEGAWLFAHSDLLVTKIKSSGATLILTSVRAPGGEVLSIKVERLDTRMDAMGGALPAALNRPVAVPSAPAVAKAHTNGAKAPAGKRAKAPAAIGGAAPDSISVQIGAHIRTRGDMSFIDTPWAGRVGPGLWIESFSVLPLQHFTAADIEYKGLTGSGFETPWLSDDKMCGTKGMAVPLVGFAVRLKPTSQSALYDCTYSGYYKSGLTVGPLRNGAPCRSTVANDPLEGIQVSLVKRGTASAAASAPVPTAAAARAAGPRDTGKGSGPSFGRYREEAGHTNGNGTATRDGAAPTKGKTVKALAPAKLKRKSAARRKANGRAHPSLRATSRRN